MPEVERIPVGDLTPHPRNVRQGDVGAIVESLKAHGQYRPIIVQRSTGYILVGNHTLLAATTLGWGEVDAITLDVDDEEALRILLVDNRTSDLAIYDDGGLADLLKELVATDAGLGGTAWDSDDLDDLLYRLQGDPGTITPGTSSAEAVEEWRAKGIRTVILPYPQAEWVEVNDLLSRLRDERGVETNSDLILAMAREAAPAGA